MATIYEYEHICCPANVSKIHADVEISLMTDKSIEFCTWNFDEHKLYVCFTNELSVDDKTILDEIVINNKANYKLMPFLKEEFFKAPDGKQYKQYVNNYGIVTTELLT